jgi:hypothetical protein
MGDLLMLARDTALCLVIIGALCVAGLLVINELFP